MTLYTKIYQTPRSSGNIVYMMSCRIYIINSTYIQSPKSLCLRWVHVSSSDGLRRTHPELQLGWSVTPGKKSILIGLHGNIIGSRKKCILNGNMIGSSNQKKTYATEQPRLQQSTPQFRLFAVAAGLGGRRSLEMLRSGLTLKSGANGLPGGPR